MKNSTAVFKDYKVVGYVAQDIDSGPEAQDAGLGVEPNGTMASWTITDSRFGDRKQESFDVRSRYRLVLEQWSCGSVFFMVLRSGGRSQTLRQAYCQAPPSCTSPVLSHMRSCTFPNIAALLHFND